MEAQKRHILVGNMTPSSQNTNRTEEKYKYIMLVIIFVLVGIALLIWGYFLDKSHPFISFLMLQIGALLIFGAGYTAISDYVLRQNFYQIIRENVDIVKLDSTIKAFGLMEIQSSFSSDKLRAEVADSCSVRMLVLRSNTFITSSYDAIRERMLTSSFSLSLILPNPHKMDLMTLLAPKFSDDNTAEKLSEKIQTVVRILKQEIHDKLKDEQRSQLKVYYVDKYPLYSAYEFDQRQFWYIPYHHRKDKQQLAVFVFGQPFNNVPVYMDFEALIQEANLYDFSK
jgi:hypothetical protein